jgi:hypothetical protein
MAETVKNDAALTEEQQQEAARLQAEIAAFLVENREHKAGLEQNFVEIGSRLATIRTGRYWRVWQFKNFSQYMKSLESRTQNYHCLGVARDLLSLVSKEQLVKIGISKASILRAMVKGGKAISPELIAMAQDKTKEELEGAVDKELGLVEDDTPGKWFSYGGAKMEDAERAEFLRTVNLVVRTADLGGEEIVSWQEVPSLRKKQIVQTLCAEFIATYAA